MKTNQSNVVSGLGNVSPKKALDEPAKQRGIMASYYRTHILPALAVIVAIQFICAAAIWLTTSLPSMLESMKKDMSNNQQSNGNPRYRENTRRRDRGPVSDGNRGMGRRWA